LPPDIARYAVVRRIVTGYTEISALVQNSLSRGFLAIAALCVGCDATPGSVLKRCPAPPAVPPGSFAVQVISQGLYPVPIDTSRIGCAAIFRGTIAGVSAAPEGGRVFRLVGSDSLVVVSGLIPVVYLYSSGGVYTSIADRTMVREEREGVDSIVEVRALLSPPVGSFPTFKFVRVRLGLSISASV
jgi:hypothetical protein